MTVDLKALAATALLAGCATTAAPSSPSPANHRCTLTHPFASAPTKAMVVAAFQALKPQVGACMDQFKTPGMYTVDVDVAADGAFEQICVDSGAAGAETARCMEEAARKSLRLPATGAPYSLAYPFILR